MRTYGRRTFLRNSAMLGAAAAAGHILPGSFVRGAASNPAAQRPFELLVLGDSVMWGQGLEEGQKFYHITRRWLEGVLDGRRVNAPKVKAHSGATILPKQGEGGKCHGEVNFSSPTINAQLDEAAAEYADLKSVDLVLLNGGINDVGAFNLVQPSFGELKARRGANDFCYVAMKALLRKAVRTFPNARVVVTGYFPLITLQTPPDMLLDLILLAITDNENLDRVAREIFEAARRGLRLRPGQVGPILSHAARVSDVWYAESALALRRAVEEVNDELGGVVRGANCEQSGGAPVVPAPRVLFARPGFCAENGYGVEGTSYLFKLVKADRPFDRRDSPIDRLRSNDELFEERAQWCGCDAAHKNNLEFKICQRAGTAHPNQKGAAEYGRVVQKALESILPFTGWAGAPRPAPPSVVSAAPAVVARAAVRRGSEHPFFMQAAKPTEVIAHRGGAGQWPEETMYAFERAVGLGVDVLEMDVHSTRDCELVLMHDDSVDRTTDGGGRNIGSMTLAEVKELNAGYKWTADGGRTFPFRCKGVQVPTLREVFQAFRGRRMNIEIKQSNPALVARLCRMIREFEMTDKVLVASFDPEALRAFRAQCPEVATSTSKRELINFVFRRNPFAAASAPEVDAVQIAEQFLIGRLGDFYLNKAREHKLPLHAWTVNNAREMRRLLGLGLDGIITDYPEMLLQERARFLQR